MNFIAGVCLSHAILLHQVSEMGMRGDDVVLNFSTIYWISGLLIMICNAIKGFCRLMTTERFTPELVLGMIEEHRVSDHFVHQIFILETNLCFFKKHSLGYSILQCKLWFSVLVKM